MNSSPVDDPPTAVFRRLDKNALEATDVFFIGKQHTITFGNSSVSDIKMKSKACPPTFAVARYTDENSWNITCKEYYDNACHLYVNEMLLKQNATESLESGDKIRFKAANVDVTYSFQVYSKHDPHTSFDMKCYVEKKLKAWQAKADTVKKDCIKLNSELDKLTHVKDNTEVVYPKRFFTPSNSLPMVAFKLISSNVTAPAFYFFKNIVTTLGKSPVCDIVIKSEECFPVEATVKRTTKWQITNDGKHQLFVNDRYFDNCEMLNLKSGDKIQFGKNETFNLIYEFQVFLDRIFFPSKHEAKKFLETQLNKLQKDAPIMDHLCNLAKLKLMKMNAKIKNQPPTAVLLKNETNNKIKAAVNFASVNDSKNEAKKKRDETYESSKKIKLESEGSKDMENELLKSGNKSPIVKCENVCTSQANIKTKEIDVSKSKSKTLTVKSGKAAATKMKVKTEPVRDNMRETPAVMHEEGFWSDLNIKTELIEAFEIKSKPSEVKCEEVNANEVKIKRKPIEVIEID